MCENTLSFPPIFLGEIVADETVDEAVGAAGIAGADCFIVADDISLI